MTLRVAQRLRDQLAANDPVNAYVIEEFRQSRDVRLRDHFAIERQEPGRFSEVARLLDREQAEGVAAMMQADSGVSFVVKLVRAATRRA